ncbi:hypothetical protein B0H13DRAFT_2300097 [Mycena leptocephala]|nr:hypothetical protein B0H13DRAFT_2300097 [Mycena leptocephala]
MDPQDPCGMFSRCNHQTAPEQNLAPPTPQVQPLLPDSLPSPDLLSAHHHHLESLPLLRLRSSTALPHIWKRILARWHIHVDRSNQFPFREADPVWPGVRFKKDFLYEVLKIKSSSTTEIDGWFAPKMLEGAPKARAWVESDGVDNNNKFEKMKTSEFKKYLTEHLKADAPKARKHKRSSSDEDVSRHRRRRVASEDLDG